MFFGIILILLASFLNVVGLDEHTSFGGAIIILLAIGGLILIFDSVGLKV